MEGRLTRREAVKLTAAAGLTATLGPTLWMLEQRKRVLRIAHLADIHVQPERRAYKGMARVLEIVNEMEDKPDLILTGGDLIMDSMDCDASRTKVQWDLFTKTLRDYNALHIEHCIGNHDVWGWNKPSSKTNGLEPLWGKRWALDVLELESPYRSFDRAGWHFIVLDSTYPQGDAYVAKLDEEQFDWLKDDLQRTAPETPVLVVSHIPIMAACAYFHGKNEQSGDWQVPGAWVHIDARRIKDLFRFHPNVKLCLSGHMHLADRVDYLGVSYFCNGAVCGEWWNGYFQECPPGYAIVDLYNDGSFENQYVAWDWEEA